MDHPARKIQRFGHVIKIKPKKLQEYKEHHANVWPAVLEMIKKCGILNYSIYAKDNYLFSYMEYDGTDFDADMKKKADDPITQEWWSVVGPCQEPLETRKKGEWWAGMEEVFHVD